MPYTIDWYARSRVGHVHLLGTFSMDDLYNLNECLHFHVERGRTSTFLLVNDENVTKVSMGLQDITDALNFIRQPDLVWAVAYGSAMQSLEFTVPLIAKILGVKFDRRNTLEDAINFLMECDPTLQHLEIE